MTEEGQTRGGVLDRVRDPCDLRRLSEDELPLLAEELRREIVSGICDTGGHLASSLGVVELAIAVHYVFHTPDDKLIWDVGHQCYPHKLLTGRRDKFTSVRRYQGLSGFPKRAESPYDSFGTGHASTSVSAALGMAEAIKLANGKEQVLAVIGDGGLTGGMAFEALNQTPTDLCNLTVILNDNEMSISPSVGRLSTFLSKSVVSRPMQTFNQVMRRIARPLPEWLYTELRYLGKRWRQSFLTFWTPGILFEALGYHYIGPVDGHDIEQLLAALRNARDLEEPVLLHVLTTKGKGYQFAEDSPSAFHGVGPFDIDTGECPPKQGPPSYTRVFSDTMIELFEGHEKLVGITAAMSQGTGLDRVAEVFPSRVFDLGITEQHCVTFAAGMACQGFRPVVAIYSTFLQRAYDQVVHDICLQNLPVIFCLDRAGIVGEDGPTHHGLFDISYLRSMPNMSVLAPADEKELRDMLHTIASRNGGPVAIRYPRGRGAGATLDKAPEHLPWAKAELRRQGKDLVIAAIGNMVPAAEQAADILEKQGLQCAVINARFVKPLDTGLILGLAAEAGVLVTVEENQVAGGFGSAVLEALSDAAADHVAVKVMGIKDSFPEHGPPPQLRADLGLDPENIARAITEFMRLLEKERAHTTPA